MGKKTTATPEMNEVVRTMWNQCGGGWIPLMIGVKAIHIGESQFVLAFKAEAKDGLSAFGVEYMPSDTYKVSFYKPGVKKPLQLVSEVEDVYCDSLKRLIEEKLGLRLTLY